MNPKLFPNYYASFSFDLFFSAWKNKIILPLFFELLSLYEILIHLFHFRHLLSYFSNSAFLFSFLFFYLSRIALIFFENLFFFKCFFLLFVIVAWVDFHLFTSFFYFFSPTFLFLLFYIIVLIIFLFCLIFGFISFSVYLFKKVLNLFKGNSLLFSLFLSDISFRKTLFLDFPSFDPGNK